MHLSSKYATELVKGENVKTFKHALAMLTTGFCRRPISCCSWKMRDRIKKLLLRRICLLFFLLPLRDRFLRVFMSMAILLWFNTSIGFSLALANFSTRFCAHASRVSLFFTKCGLDKLFFAQYLPIKVSEWKFSYLSFELYLGSHFDRFASFSGRRG